ncbi:MAG: hypothetical protein FWE07_08285 [Turicibacter sp.]|nr:hypothetical protein [Turicibacter sp.]
MNKNVIIASTGMYHPKRQVGNDFFIDHFTQMDEELGEKVAGLLEKVGRINRYLADFPKENVITMSVAASRSAIEAAGIDVSELDGIVFATETPEYTTPTNAVMLNDALEATNAHVVYDMNANCIGMVAALDQVQAIMKVNQRLNKVLVVGSTMAHHYGLKTSPITYANIGDAAVAVLLEKVEAEHSVGFIDALYCTKTAEKDSVLMPACGMSYLFDPDVPEEDKRLIWHGFDPEEPENRCVEMMKGLLQENGCELNQVKRIFFNQLNQSMIESVADKLGYPFERFKYVGDQYGYTGLTSLFLAYYHAVQEGELQTGDVVVFCSIGAGITAAASLYVVA